VWAAVLLSARLQRRLGAFIARFGRLQGLLGDQFLPAHLRAIQAPAAAMLQNLDRAERLRLIRSADVWAALRRLRNRLIREYRQSDEDRHAALMAAFGGNGAGCLNGSAKWERRRSGRSPWSVVAMQHVVPSSGQP